MKTETSKEILLLDAGRMDFKRAWRFQKQAVTLVTEERAREIYFLVEHDPVYTAGLHFQNQQTADNTEILKLERGGGVTFHGPGQLVVYPVVNLARRGFTIKDLIMRMQSAVIDTLLEFGLTGEGKLGAETGVWVNSRKICSTGFYIKGSVTMHGLALNVNTDLQYFYSVNPCGFSPDIMTSMEKELNKGLDFSSVKNVLESKVKEKMNIDHFLRVSGRDLSVVSDISELLSETAP